MIKVLVTGAAGKMGQEVCRAVLNQPDLDLVAAVDINKVGTDLGELIGFCDSQITVRSDLNKTIEDTNSQVMVDFTHSSAVIGNIETALRKKVHCVIGTTGISASDLKSIASLADRSEANIIIAPNFALGAVLMMKFSSMAARYLPDVEIIELHHNQKADAPSGTSLKTAEMIAASRREKPQKNPDEQELVEAVRGGKVDEIPIHSIRLPGLVAHQAVVFGGQGQTLTIRHDSVDRTSFMPGVILAIHEVFKRKGLTYGLDKLLDI